MKTEVLPQLPLPLGQERSFSTGFPYRRNHRESGGRFVGASIFCRLESAGQRLVTGAQASNKLIAVAIVDEGRAQRALVGVKVGSVRRDTLNSITGAAPGKRQTHQHTNAELHQVDSSGRTGDER